MENKHFPTMKSKYKSEFSMGVYDFERLDTILKNIDDASVRSTCLSKDAILPYFAATKQMYNFLRPFITLSWKKNVTVKMDRVCEELWIKTLDWHIEDFRINKELSLYPLDLVKQIERFHSELLTIKQTFGFGLVMNRELATKSKIAKYLGTTNVRGSSFDKRIKVE
jgi:hypothetical protein